MLSDEVWAKIQVDISVAATVEIGDIDVFNIYAPVCLQSSNGTYYSSSYVRKPYHHRSYQTADRSFTCVLVRSKHTLL